MNLYRVCGRFVSKACRDDRLGKAEAFSRNFIALDDNEAKSFVFNWLQDKKKAELVKLFRIDVLEETSLVKEFT